jgi:hypothetical protein
MSGSGRRAWQKFLKAKAIICRVKFRNMSCPSIAAPAISADATTVNNNVSVTWTSDLVTVKAALRFLHNHVMA